MTNRSATTWEAGRPSVTRLSLCIKSVSPSLAPRKVAAAIWRCGGRSRKRIALIPSSRPRTESEGYPGAEYKPGRGSGKAAGFDYGGAWYGHRGQKGPAVKVSLLRYRVPVENATGKKCQTRP